MEKEEKVEMLNPFCDEGFKRIFGDKILLMDFLNSFVDAGGKITDLTYENKELVSVEDDGRTKFKKSNNGCVDHFEEWIYNLKNMERMGNVEFKDQEVFERLWNLSNNTMLSLEERHRYERSLKAYRDYVNQIDYAKEEGRKEGTVNTIHLLRKSGMSDEEIASRLGMDIDLVKSM